MRTLGVGTQIVAGLAGLAAAMLLFLVSLGFFVDGDDNGSNGLYLLLSGSSVLVYAVMIASAPAVWASSRRRALLGGLFGGVVLTMGLSGGAGGMVLYAPGGAVGRADCRSRSLVAGAIRSAFAWA